jgi:drug/metabolite transporter (DMT)-like permease
MLAFAALIAGSFSLGDIAAPHIAPEALTWLRFLLAMGVMGGICLSGPGFRRAHFRAPWRYAILGALLALYFVLMFVALRITTPVATSAVFTLTPIMAAGFGWLLLRQVATPRMALALALAGCGAVWVIFRADLNAILALDLGRGEAIFFVGCAGHALYPPLVRLFNRGEPVPVFTFGMLTASFVIVTIYALLTGALVATPWLSLPPIVWVTALYLGVATTALTTFLVQYSAMRLPAAKVMAYGYLVPSFVILWEVAFGHGWVAAPVMAGVAATVLAMGLLLRD